MPVINNAYMVTDDNYAYAPSDLDTRHPDMSRKDVNALIDSLCKERMENPDVVIMDRIQQRYPNDPIKQERIELLQDNIAVEEEVLKNIFESETPMSIEERNDLIANGIYDKYQNMKAKKLGKTVQQMAKEEHEAMNLIEEELKAGINKPIQGDIESVTEVISEEITEDNSFQGEQNESMGTGEIAVEVEGTALFEENTGYAAIEIEPITEEEANKMACFDSLGNEEFKPTEEDKKEMETKDTIKKLLNFSNAAMSVPYNDDKDTAYLSEVIDTISNPEKLVPAIEEYFVDKQTDNKEDYQEMSIEEFNDVPATNISLPDDVVTSVLLEKYDSVDARDAAQLISVMKRYKDGEKFNVFESLPESIKTVINKEAASVNADKSTINFFAKSFINDLINDTYLDREIQDFNEQMNEVMAPMGNIVGTLMDEYTDDVYEKFTTQLLEKAEQIRPDNENKANQLVTIAHNFEEAINMTRLINLIDGNPSIINYYYKRGRDKWTKMIRDYDEFIANIKPTPRDLKTCLKGLLSIGIREDIAKTIMAIAVASLEKAISAKTLEEHIYAYYLTNSFMTISFTANTSNATSKIITAIGELNNIIDEAMKVLIERNSKKQRKRNRRK
jgi:hypothetical protein